MLAPQVNTMKRTESEILAMELVFRENYGREMNEQEREYFNLPPAPPLTIEQRLRKIRSRLEPHVTQRN
jgi:hypothetical protein